MPKPQERSHPELGRCHAPALQIRAHTRARLRVLVKRILIPLWQEFDEADLNRLG
ncbi:MAG: hypothetical protein IE886_07035 [Campylobacterales bacterium]|nr:hypothetical protein [Campylobacterales bacterium]